VISPSTAQTKAAGWSHLSRRTSLPWRALAPPLCDRARALRTHRNRTSKVQRCCVRPPTGRTSATTSCMATWNPCGRCCPEQRSGNWRCTRPATSGGLSGWAAAALLTGFFGVDRQQSSCCYASPTPPPFSLALCPPPPTNRNPLASIIAAGTWSATAPTRCTSPSRAPSTWQTGRSTCGSDTRPCGSARGGIRCEC